MAVILRFFMFTESFRIAPDNADYILSQYDMLGFIASADIDTGLPDNISSCILTI